MLAVGDIAFFDVAEPILGFRRGTETGAMLCIFNLSAEPHAVAVTGLHEGTGLEPVSERAVLADGVMQLAANGYAFIALDASSTAAVSDLG